MTVDRERIRQEHVNTIREALQRMIVQDLDSWKEPYARKAYRALEALLNELEQAEARLAKVPALVEALQRIEHYPFAVISNDQSDLRLIKDLAHDALAAWDAV